MAKYNNHRYDGKNEISRFSLHHAVYLLENTFFKQLKFRMHLDKVICFRNIKKMCMLPISNALEGFINQTDP